MVQVAQRKECRTTKVIFGFSDENFKEFHRLMSEYILSQFLGSCEQAMGQLPDIHGNGLTFVFLYK